MTGIALLPLLALLLLFPAPAPAAATPEDLYVQALQAERGQGVPHDPARALALYCQAADLGHAGAAFAVGWAYFHGRGVARDDGAALRWFATAARRGHSGAARLLARLGGKAAEDIRCAQPEVPRPAVESGPAIGREIAALVERMAPEYGLDPRLVLAVIAAESAFRPAAVSPKGARGLMQLMPATAERFGVRDSFDPGDNIRGGMRYLRWLLSFFQGDVTLALAGYNAGEQRVLQYGGVPPYDETRAYVERIRRLYPAARHPYDPAAAVPARLKGR